MKHKNLKMPTKIAIYIRFGSETFSCILPDEADKLRKYYAEHRGCAPFEKPLGGK